MQVLNEFADASGLKVNIRKSRTLYSKVVMPSLKEEIYSITYTNFCKDLGKYIGFPLIQAELRKKTSIFD